MKKLSLSALIIVFSNTTWAVEFFCWNSENSPAQAVRFDSLNVLCNYMVVCEPVTDGFKKKVESVAPSKKYDDLTDDERTMAIQSPFLNQPNPLGKISNIYCKGTIKNETSSCPGLRECQKAAIDIFPIDPPAYGAPAGKTIQKRSGSVN